MNIIASYRSNLSRIVSLLTTVLLTLSASAQFGRDWCLRSPQPWGDTLTSLVKTDTRIIAVGVGTALVQSLDNGATWTSLQIVPTAPFHSETVSIAWNGLSGSNSKLIYASDNGLWTSTVGDEWSALVTDVPMSQPFSHIIWTGSNWAALVTRFDMDTAKLRLMTSADGAHWTQLGFLSEDANATLSISKMIYTGSHYVMVGWQSSRFFTADRGALLSTADGTTWGSWFLADSSTDATRFTDVAWSGSRAVAIGRNNSERYFSYTTTAPMTGWTRHDVNGTTPTPTWDNPNPDYIQVETVVATSSHLVSAQYSTVSVSPLTDGGTWTKLTNPVEQGVYPRTMLWSGSQIIAAGLSGVVYFAGADGTGWVRKTPTAPLLDWQCVAVNPTTGVLVASDAYNQVHRSTNGGDTWTQITTDPFEVMTHGAWDNTGGRFVAAAGWRFSTSTDGLSWTNNITFSDDPMAPTSDNSDWITNIAANSGTLVAVGDSRNGGNGAIWSKSSSGSWTKRTVPAGARSLRTIARIGLQWIAGGDTETILTSSDDGITWTKRTVPSAYGMSIRSIAANGATPTIIVAVGSYGGQNYFTSPNGTTWTKRSLPVYDSMSSIVWTGSNFVMVGEAGAICTSPDGINWTTQYSRTHNKLNEVIWDNTKSQVLAVGDAGNVHSSDLIPVAQFASLQQTVLENEGTISVQVRLSLPAITGFTIPINVAGTASGSLPLLDFTFSPSSVSFAPGESEKTVMISIEPDTDIEASETIQLTLNATANNRIAAPTTHTITITDDDSPPTVDLVSTSALATEHSGSVGVGLVLPWPAPVGGVDVPLTVGGTVDASDYSLASSPVHFDEGQVVAFARIGIIGDGLAEPDETMTVTLGAPSGAALGTSTVFTLTIQDDGGSTPAENPIGKLWTVRQPTPSADLLNSIVVIPGLRQVIVGEGGAVLTSEFDTGPTPSVNNGASWTSRFSGASGAAEFSEAAWNGNLIAAVGNEGVTMVSPNGIDWAASTVPNASEMTNLESIATDGVSGRMVAVGSYFDGNSLVPIIYSTVDGVHWREEVTPPALTGQLTSVVWSQSKSLYLAVGYVERFDPTNGASLLSQAIVLSSTDGRIWQNRSPSLTGASLTQVVSANTSFIAFDGTKYCYTSSDDGSTWIKITTGSLGTLETAAYDGSKLVGMGSATAISSTKGSSWTQKASPTKNLFSDVVWTGVNFIAISEPSGIYTSPDGSVWTRKSAGVELPGPLGGVVWTGKQFVAVGGQMEDSLKALIITSPDGVTWTQRTTTLPIFLTRIAWSGSTLVAVGGAGVVLTSTDGVAWTPRSTGVTLHLWDVIWAGNQFVAVGGNDVGENIRGVVGGMGTVVLTSPNGLTWTRRAVPTTQPLAGIEWNGSLFVATGRAASGVSGQAGNAVVLTSTNAINWTLRDSGLASHDLYHVTWGNGRFVAVGDDMTVRHSTDGISWTPASSLPSAPGGKVPTFYDVLWADDRFVAGGDYGLCMVSTDGDTWTLSQTALKNGPILGLMSNGRTLVAVGNNASVQTSGPGDLIPLPTPSVRFDVASSTVSESGLVANVLVTMSSAPTGTVTVPFTATTTDANMLLTGTLADVTVPVSPLVFKAGETSKFISIVIKTDTRAEGNETIRLTLGAPTDIVPLAALGSPFTHDLTIQDDDAGPAIPPGGDPTHQLIAVGSELTLSVTATGNAPLRYQWRKNGAAVSGATGAVYYLPKAALTNAGAYTCAITNASGTAVSAAAEVGVFDKLVKNNASLPTKDVILTQLAAGNGITLTWQKDGGAPPGDVVYDATKKTLTIKQALDPLTDAGQYVCKITQAATATTVDGNVYNVDVITAKPTLDAAGVPDPLPGSPAAIGKHFAFTVLPAASSVEVSSWSAAGLPTGLTMNSVTGEITGYPTAVATNKAVTVTATNGNGATSIVTHITVLGLPTGLAGVSNGIMDRHPTINNNLGGKVTMTITAVGSFTGSYTVGSAAAQPFTGQAIVDTNTTAHGSTTFLTSGKLVTVSFTYDASAPANTGGGQVSVEIPGVPGSVSTAVRTWRTHDVSTDYNGKHTYAMHLKNPIPVDLSIPQGIGYGNATVTSVAAASYVGKMGDGTAYTTSSFVGRDGRSPIYVSLYTGKGSFMAIPLITPAGGSPAYSDTTIIDTSDATWTKLADASAAAARNYPAGWSPIDLKLEGSEYTAPLNTQVVMGMSYTPGGANASLDFNEAGIGDTPPRPDLSVNVRPMPATTIDPVPTFNNPRKTTLTVTGSTGAFLGSFVMVDMMPNGAMLTRTVPYAGVLVRIIGTPTVWQGVGVFSLPQLPSAEISPMPLPTTTPILAGRVELTPY